MTSTWVITKNGYSYHGVSAVANGDELLEPDEAPSTEPETAPVSANGRGNGDHIWLYYHMNYLDTTGYLTSLKSDMWQNGGMGSL